MSRDMHVSHSADRSHVSRSSLGKRSREVGWDPDTVEFWGKVAELGRESYRAAKRKVSVDRQLAFMLAGTTLRLADEATDRKDGTYSPSASGQE